MQHQALDTYTARKYASMGANLSVHKSKSEKSEALCHEIESEFGVKCEYKIADLSNLAGYSQSGRRTVSKLNTPIDVLIHNAGIYLTKRELTPDGLEKVFVIQYLSSFIINYHFNGKAEISGKGQNYYG